MVRKTTCTYPTHNITTKKNQIPNTIRPKNLPPHVQLALSYTARNLLRSPIVELPIHQRKLLRCTASAPQVPSSPPPATQYHTTVVRNTSCNYHTKNPTTKKNQRPSSILSKNLPLHVQQALSHTAAQHTHCLPAMLTDTIRPLPKPPETQLQNRQPTNLTSLTPSPHTQCQDPSPKHTHLLSEQSKNPTCPDSLSMLTNPFSERDRTPKNPDSLTMHSNPRSEQNRITQCQDSPLCAQNHFLHNTESQVTPNQKLRSAANPPYTPKPAMHSPTTNTSQSPPHSPYKYLPKPLTSHLNPQLHLLSPPNTQQWLLHTLSPSQNRTSDPDVVSTNSGNRANL